jgi:hypothetical protein
MGPSPNSPTDGMGHHSRLAATYVDAEKESHRRETVTFRKVSLNLLLFSFYVPQLSLAKMYRTDDP